MGAEEKITEILDKIRERSEKVSLLEVAIKNAKAKCWWNANKCPYYSEIAGFQDLKNFCFDCNQVDWKMFVELAKDLPAICDLVEEIKEKAEEEGWREGREKGLEEVYEKVAGRFGDFIKDLKKEE